jgi:hypothetical protein
MKRFLRAIGVLFSLLLVVVIGTAIYFYVQYKPYLTMPDVDEAKLEAEFAEYGKIRDELVARPMDDHAALLAYFKKIEPTAGVKGLSYEMKEFCEVEYPDEKIEKLKAAIECVEANMPALENILADGLKLPGETVQESLDDSGKILNLGPIRNLTEILTIQVTEDALSGNSHLSTERLMVIDRVSAGLKENPILLYSMIARWMDDQFLEALIFTMPDMSDKDLRFLQSNAHVFTVDPYPHFLNVLKVEAAGLPEIIGLFETFAPPRKDPQIIAIAWALKIPWFKKKERLAILRDQSFFLNSFSEWMDDHSKPMMLWEVPNDPARGLLSEMAYYNIGNNARRIVESQALVSATKLAVQKELSRRAAGSTATFEVPVDDTRTIAVGDARGCIVTKTAAGDTK